MPRIYQITLFDVTSALGAYKITLMVFWGHFSSLIVSIIMNIFSTKDGAYAAEGANYVEYGN